MHTLLDLRGSIPSVIRISDGKLGDVNVLDILELERGALYIMDRGYLDFGRLYMMHKGASFLRHTRQVEYASSARLFGF